MFNFLRILTPATKKDLDKVIEKVEKIAMKLKETYDIVVAAVAAIHTSVDGIRGDIERLKALLQQYIDSPGTDTPEGIAMLNEMQSLVQGLVPKVQEIDNMSEPPEEPPVV